MASYQHIAWLLYTAMFCIHVNHAFSMNMFASKSDFIDNSIIQYILKILIVMNWYGFIHVIVSIHCNQGISYTSNWIKTNFDYISMDLFTLFQTTSISQENGICWYEKGNEPKVSTSWKYPLTMEEVIQIIKSMSNDLTRSKQR